MRTKPTVSLRRTSPQCGNFQRRVRGRFVTSWDKEANKKVRVPAETRPRRPYVGDRDADGTLRFVLLYADPDVRFELDNVWLVLVQPVGDGPVSNFLEEHGEGFFHAGFQVDDVKAEAERIEAEGIRLVNRVPRRGVEGWQLVDLEMDETFCSRLRDELAVVWESIPLPLWVATYENFQTWLGEQGFPDWKLG